MLITSSLLNACTLNNWCDDRYKLSPCAGFTLLGMYDLIPEASRRMISSNKNLSYSNEGLDMAIYLIISSILTVMSAKGFKL